MTQKFNVRRTSRPQMYVLPSWLLDRNQQINLQSILKDTNNGLLLQYIDAKQLTLTKHTMQLKKERKKNSVTKRLSLCVQFTINAKYSRARWNILESIYYCNLATINNFLFLSIHIECLHDNNKEPTLEFKLMKDVCFVSHPSFAR